MSVRQLRDIPGVDEIRDRLAIFRSRRRHVAYSLPLASCVFGASREGLTPVLVTRADAVVSHLASLELMRHGAHWVVEHSDGTLEHALYRRCLTTLDDLQDPEIFHELPKSAPSHWEESQSWAAVGAEILVFHRAEADQLVGELAEEVIGAIDGSHPDVWGDTEPLAERWSYQAITRAAHEQMPISGPIRFSTPSGASGFLAYTRTPNGITERLRVSVPLGPYRDHHTVAGELAADVLGLVQDRFVPVFGHMTIQDVDPGGGQGFRVRRPEVPQSLLIGSWAIGEAEIDLDHLVADFDAELVGHRYLPAVVARFDRTDGPPGMEFSRLMNSIGLDRVWDLVSGEGPTL